MMYILFLCGMALRQDTSFLNEGLIPQLNPGGAAHRPEFRATCRRSTCAPTSTFRALHSLQIKGQIGASKKNLKNLV